MHRLSEGLAAAMKLFLHWFLQFRRFERALLFAGEQHERGKPPQQPTSGIKLGSKDLPRWPYLLPEVLLLSSYPPHALAWLWPDAASEAPVE